MPNESLYMLGEYKWSDAPDLYQIRYFLAVADQLSFSAAAKQLNIAQPAISRAVRKMEDSLGFHVFKRTTRMVQLTPAGEILQNDFKDIMNSLANSISEARRSFAGEVGEIVIGYTNFAAHGPMSDLIVRFQTHYEQTRVGLRLLGSTEQLSALENGTIDFGFLLTLACDQSTKQLVVSQEKLVLLLAADNPLVRCSGITPDILSSIPLVTGVKKRWSTYRRVVGQLCERAGIQLDFVEEADDLPILLRLVASGIGGLIYDASIGPYLPPDIISIPIIEVVETLDTSLAWSSRSLTPMAQNFLDFCRTEVHATKKQ
ncbi:MAG: LysR family transcriptional regulator [Roseovarius sp.]|nr:LysR family transcriptional regulator [Roseovarius sp.]|tara:strand:+ start:276 stop:1223 length:948 start_codon:yes stop_codon:yes gene_type:complete